MRQTDGDQANHQDIGLGWNAGSERDNGARAPGPDPASCVVLLQFQRNRGGDYQPQWPQPQG